MKSYMFKSIIFSVIALMLWSCKKDETRIVVSANATAPAAEAMYESLVLQEDNKAADVMQIKWDKADFGYDAAVNYTIEIAKKDANFADAKGVNMGNGLSRIFTVGALNALVNQLDVVGFEENELEVRVKAEIGGGVAPVYSNVIPLTVVPFLDKPPYQTLYLVGDATANGWDNAKASPVYRNPDDAFLYTFTGYFGAGSFKYLGKLGAWTPMWGITDGAVAFRATEADPDPGSFSITTAGFYTVTLNLKNNTIVGPTAYDASGATVYPSIGIIGAFNGWGNIEPMTHPANDPHNWSITHTFDTDTEVKFRIAADWSVNWGAASVATQNEVYGKGQAPGENIKMTAGTYTIIFNDMTLEYVFIKQ